MEWIKMSIEELERYAPIPKDFNAFRNDRAAQLITERLLIVIGEAVMRIQRDEPELALSDMKKIIRVRNILAHDYEHVSVDNLFVIYERHIPILKAEVAALLEQP
ncbi:MAG: DUF86 domain-containing protein [Flavobacteriales bacterium]|nr:DUF86 domain-containing protein [Flavobacteriales bacterium]